jgi:hypothetical protein
MKTEFFEMSIKAGQKAFDGIKQAESDVMTTDCPLAAIQFEQATGKRPIHPLQVLSKAYTAPGKGGFAKCYEFTSQETGQINAAKVILKASLTKSRAK